MPNSAKVFLNRPIAFKNLCYIYPPQVKDVVDNPLFGQLAQILTMSQEEIDDMMLQQSEESGTAMQKLTPFEMIMATSHDNLTFKSLVEKAFKFFTREDIRMSSEHKMIFFTSGIERVKSIEDIKVLKEEDFFDFQNIIRSTLGDKEIEPPDPDEDPRVAKIKAKARERERVKKKTKTKNGISLATSLTALCCMGIGLNPLNIGDISYASVGRLMTTYQGQEKYRSDLLMISGGADPKKVRPKYWIKNLDE